jgi:hypothetical protein
MFPMKRERGQTGEAGSVSAGYRQPAAKSRRSNPFGTTSTEAQIVVVSSRHIAPIDSPNPAA